MWSLKSHISKSWFKNVHLNKDCKHTRDKEGFICQQQLIMSYFLNTLHLMVGDCWRLEGLLLIGVVTTHSAGNPPGSPLKALFASCLCAISVFSQRRHLVVHVQPATSSQSWLCMCTHACGSRWRCHLMQCNERLLVHQAILQLHQLQAGGEGNNYELTWPVKRI